MSLLTYLIIGIAFNTYIGQSLTLVQRTINPWWLEEVFVSPTRLSTFIIGSSAWGFIWSTVSVVIYLTVGSVIFGAIFNLNVLGVIFVLILGIGTFIGFSMVGAGVLIVTKQGDPITWLIGMLTILFGNVLFPPQVMPPYLEMISYIIPQYYFFTCIRLALIGWPIETFLSYILTLALMCATMLTLDYFVLSWCLRIVRKKGTLAWF